MTCADPITILWIFLIGALVGALGWIPLTLLFLGRKYAFVSKRHDVNRPYDAS